MLIGLSGAAGSGKDTVGAALREQLNYRRASFARPLKEALNVIFGWSLHSWDILEWKETPRPECYGLTPRQLAQSLGTDWGRNNVHSNIWVDSALAQLSRQGGNVDRWVFTDVRFPNEAKAIRDYGGVLLHVVCVDRPSGTDSDAHASEAWTPWLLEFADAVLEANFGQIERLQEAGVATAQNYLSGIMPPYQPSDEVWDFLSNLEQEIEATL